MDPGGRRELALGIAGCPVGGVEPAAGSAAGRRRPRVRPRQAPFRTIADVRRFAEHIRQPTVHHVGQIGPVLRVGALGCESCVTYPAKIIDIDPALLNSAKGAGTTRPHSTPRSGTHDHHVSLSPLATTRGCRDGRPAQPRRARTSTTPAHAADDSDQPIKVAMINDVDTFNPFTAVLLQSTGINRYQYEALVGYGTQQRARRRHRRQVGDQRGRQDLDLPHPRGPQVVRRQADHRRRRGLHVHLDHRDHRAAGGQRRARHQHRRRQGHRSADRGHDAEVGPGAQPRPGDPDRPQAHLGEGGRREVRRRQGRRRLRARSPSRRSRPGSRCQLKANPQLLARQAQGLRRDVRGLQEHRRRRAGASSPARSTSSTG